MKSKQSEIRPLKTRKIRTILWFLMVISILFSVMLGLSDLGPDILPFLFAVMGLSVMIVLYIKSEKFYNWPIWFIIMFIAGFFLKRQHWPMAGAFLTGGCIFLCITALLNTVRYHILFPENSFLKWFGSISGIIISTYMFGWLFMVQHWPKEVGDILGYIGIILFVLSILGMVFTLPGSKYMGWSVIEKKTFFRTILIPMGIVFTLIIITLVFSDVFIWLIDRNPPPLGLDSSIELLNLNGIPEL